MGERRRFSQQLTQVPLGYFLTWATYGTWLAGDDRGWIDYRHGWQVPDPARKLEAEARMTEDACILDIEHRQLVEKTVADHCQIRGWQLYAVNCRTNHLHVVVTANRDPDEIRKQFKAWCTRRLKELERQRLTAASVGTSMADVDTHPTRERGSAEVSKPRLRVGLVSPHGEETVRENWWAERGSRRSINDEVSLEAAILYVRDAQDRPRGD